MKVTFKAYSVLLLFVLIAPFSIVSADPFAGEGKQGYIERCISSSEMPGRSISEKEAFCKCFANKLEAGYGEVLRSIEPSDSVSFAQEKMNNMAQQYARACMP